MYILDIKYLKKQKNIYLLGSIICFIFSFIYELFSHHVYSNFMIFAGFIPLIFGYVGSIIIMRYGKLPSSLSNQLCNCSIITFTLYSILMGVLEIYGTTNNLINFYLIGGIVLGIGSIVLYIIN